MVFESKSPPPALRALVLLAGRLLAALAFLAVSLGQALHYGDACAAARSLGMPWADVYVAAASAMQFAGGLMLGLGWRARLGAAFLSASLLPAVWMFTLPAANRLYLAGALAALGGLMPYLVTGAGPYSLDNLRRVLSK
ncbi:MAG: DoxX family protein [Elusimicrobiales bacterium]